MPFIYPMRRHLWSAAALLVLAALLAPPLGAQDKAKPETPEQRLLRVVSTASPETIMAAYDLDLDLVQKIMAFRKDGKTFSTAEEFAKTTGVTVAQILNLAAATQDQEAPTTPSQRPRERMKAMPSATGTDEDTPLVSNIRPGYFGKLPGFDELDSIDPLLKKEFLERMNYEMCPCGCENETLAFCLVNDPGCPVVKARARKIYEEVLSKARPADEKAEE